MKYLILLWLMLGVGVVNGDDTCKKEDSFSLYLIEDKVKIEDIQKIDVNKVKLDNKPIFTIDDMIVYSKNNHTIKLTKDAFQKFLEIKIGKPFAVCVGHTPIYLGVVWSKIRSSAFNGHVVVAFNEKDGTTIQILNGYPTKSFFTGKDQRANEIIIHSIEKCNKLSD